MGGNASDVTGPDLRRGVPVSDLADQKLLVGHVGSEGVVLARVGEEYFAVDAACTHYSGPLGEGLLVGETIRCPWHHACFSLRTGEALRAPALRPVSCWRVARRGSHLFVTEKLNGSDSQGARTGSSSALTLKEKESSSPDLPSSVVIVGAGAAGDAAADVLRREGFEGRITVVGSDERRPFDRPNLSKDYLAGTAPEEWLDLRPKSFYDEHNVDLVLGARVESIDARGKRLLLDGGGEYAYDKLLLATGAEPIRLDVPGAHLPHVYYLRTVKDCRAIIDAAGTTAVVVGAGFIGMEVAASLRARGADVHVVAPEDLPMARVFGADVGRMIRRLHESNGVTFHLNQTVSTIDRDAVTLSGGARVAADLVVVGIGVRPVTALAERAGLQVDRGVIVDQFFRTSNPDIYAAGDVARWPYRGSAVRVEHWAVAQRQGQVAARNILGAHRAFDSVPFFWTQQYDVQIAYIGHAEGWDVIDVAGSIEGRDCAVAYRQGNVTMAVLTMNRDAVSLRAEEAMERFDEAVLRKLIPSSGADNEAEWLA